MKVMSFNVRYGTAQDGENSWPYRQQLVIDRIRAFEPDVLGLQECRDDAQADYIKNQLQDYCFIGVRRGGNSETALEMAPVLFKESAFEAVDSGHFWLNTTPNVQGSKSWGRFPRTVTWVKLARKHSSGRGFMFLNTHFDCEEQAVCESAKLLRRHVADLDVAMPVILTGDFNTNKGTPPYHVLVDDTLYDTFRQIYPDKDGETYHGFGKCQDSATIDWILASNHFVTVDAAVDRYAAGGLYPSDHYSLLATVELKKSERR